MVVNRFRSKELNDTQKHLVNMFKQYFEDVESMIEHNLNNGRYRSLALTSLEEAAMWVNKSISHEFYGESNE